MALAGSPSDVCDEDVRRRRRMVESRSLGVEALFGDASDNGVESGRLLQWASWVAFCAAAAAAARRGVTGTPAASIRLGSGTLFCGRQRCGSFGVDDRRLKRTWSRQ